MQTNNANAIPENLRRLMAERNISAQTLSYEARLPPSRISQLLRGATLNPTLYTLQSLAAALGVKIDDLVTEANSDDSQPTRN